MGTTAIHSMVSEIRLNSSIDNAEEKLILALLELDEQLFRNTLNDLIKNKGLEATFSEHLIPFLDRIGVMWLVGSIKPAQEHFISNLIRQKIIAAIDTLPITIENAPSIALFLLDNEDHEIGLLLSYFIAKNLGWRVYYFGQRVPSDNIPIMVEKVSPDVMMTLIINPRSESEIAHIENIFSKMSHIPFLISGGVFSKNIFKDCSQCNYIDGPHDFIDLILFLINLGEFTQF